MNNRITEFKGCGKKIERTQRYCGEKDCFKVISLCQTCQTKKDNIKKIIENGRNNK